MFYSIEEKERVFNSSFSFVFVRHPYERLVSGYLNKINTRHRAPSFDKTRSFVREKLGLAADEEISLGHFVDYLTDPYVGFDGVKKHNIPFHTEIQCQILFFRLSLSSAVQTMQFLRSQILDDWQVGDVEGGCDFRGNEAGFGQSNKL